MRETFEFGGPIVWKPTSEYVEQANITRFMQLHGIKDFEDLLNRANEDVGWFTESVLNFLDIKFYEPYTQVVDLSKGIAWPRWCVDGKMNIVHNCLDKYIGTPKAEETAVIWEDEEGNQLTVTYNKLFRQVNQAANALRDLGLGKGDAIGIYMPMVPELIVALLAIAKIGGMILPLFSGFGVNALATRLKDADAKALFTADGFSRRGRPVNMKTVADSAADDIPSLQHMIVLNRANLQVDLQKGRDHWWHDLVSSQPDNAETEITNAEYPIMIIYRS